MRYSLALLAALAGCISTTPPTTTPTPRVPTPVRASFGHTWDAVIDQFAAQNIPIRNMERVSGFIATGPIAAPVETRTAAIRAADCGSVNGQPTAPLTVEYNVVVRGDSATSNVHVTPRWVGEDLKGSIECVTTGAWEQLFEDRVRVRAEGMR